MRSFLPLTVSLSPTTASEFNRNQISVKRSRGRSSKSFGNLAPAVLFIFIDSDINRQALDSEGEVKATAGKRPRPFFHFGAYFELQATSPSLNPVFWNTLIILIRLQPTSLQSNPAKSKSFRYYWKAGGWQTSLLSKFPILYFWESFPLLLPKDKKWNQLEIRIERTSN